MTPGVLDAAQPRHPHERQGTQRGVELPGDREVPQRRVLSRENDRVRDQVIAEIRSAAEHLTLTVESELSVDQRSRQARAAEGRAGASQAGGSGRLAADGAVAAGAQRRHRRSDRRRRPRSAKPLPRTSPSTPRRSSTAATPPSTGRRSAPNSRTAIATAVGDNFVWAYQRAEALAAEVGAHLRRSGPRGREDAGGQRSRHGRRTSASSSRWPSWRPSRSARATRSITGMRGSYGGVLMFGMLTSFAGLGMFNPLSLGAGLVLGRKAYKEDMENRMLRVRNEAKMNMRRFVDDVSFVVEQGVARPAQEHPAPAARPLPRHRQPDDPLAERVAAGDPGRGSAGGERAQRPGAGTQRQLNILDQVVDNAIKLAPAPTPRRHRVARRQQRRRRSA